MRDGVLVGRRSCSAQGATENARRISDTSLHGWKLWDMKMQDQFTGVENKGKVSMESQSVKKCLKV